MGWPLWGLRITVDDLALTPLREADLEAVVAALPADLELDPSAYRFAQDPRSLVAHQEYWRHVGQWTPAAWKLDFGVRRDGRLLGVQQLEGNDFPVLRTVDTASWLSADARGQGVGRAMRRAVLSLAFDHLDAVAAVSSAWHDNAASLSVSRRLGYQDNGVSLMAREGSGRADTLVHLRLTAPEWAAAGQGRGVRVDGLGPARFLFGL